MVLARFLRRLVDWLFRRPTPLATVRVSELTECLEDGCIYIVGEGIYDWFVAFVCPCGCGAHIYLSVLPDASPRWSLIRHLDGAVSLSPSVQRLIGCKSHFFIKKGLVYWCSGSKVGVS